MERAGMMGFWAVTVLFLLVAALLCAGTAVSGTDMGARELEKYYREKEYELAADIRGMLQREGMENSGVMVTRVVEADGSRSYTVTVHHSGIDNMSEAERQQLLRRLENLNFEGEGCTFSHQFLLDD